MNAHLAADQSSAEQPTRPLEQAIDDLKRDTLQSTLGLIIDLRRADERAEYNYALAHELPPFEPNDDPFYVALYYISNADSSRILGPKYLDELNAFWLFRALQLLRISERWHFAEKVKSLPYDIMLDHQQKDDHATVLDLVMDIAHVLTTLEPREPGTQIVEQVSLFLRSIVHLIVDAPESAWCVGPSFTEYLVLNRNADFSSSMDFPRLRWKVNQMTQRVWSDDMANTVRIARKWMHLLHPTGGFDDVGRRPREPNTDYWASSDSSESEASDESDDDEWESHSIGNDYGTQKRPPRPTRPKSDVNDTAIRQLQRRERAARAAELNERPDIPMFIWTPEI